MKKRDERLDLIRIFALLCVISVHFLLNSGFYTEPMYGKEMIAMCIFRSFFIICVPMFITLTGYLMNKKELNLKYYKGIIKTLIIYFICSIIYSLFEENYLNKNINIITFLDNLLAFNGTKYSWYIEMYIGLFLIIPFLNLVFNNLKSKKETEILLYTLIFLIGIPSLFKVFGFKIVPSWWIHIYPIFYYFLGAYLNKYEIKNNKLLNLILLLVIVILDGIFNFYISYGRKFISSTWNDYSSITTMITTFLTFNLLLKIRFKNESKLISNIIEKISNACFGAYLISCVFDTIYYQRLKENVPLLKDRFNYAPIIIILVFINSIVVSIIINLILHILTNLLNYIKKGKKINE